MSGHSKWSTIKHKKGAADAKRGKIFTRILKEITVAARLGGSDPAGNPRLRSAIAEAKANNMPKDNIDRAIKKGSGELEGASFEEVTYEGYGPGGFAVIVEGITDNGNRTTPEIRHIFEKNGGNLGTPGSVKFQFERKGYITVPRSSASEDRVMEVVLENGAEDMKTEDADTFEIYTPVENFEQVRQSLETAGIETSESKIAEIPMVQVAADEARIKQTLKLLEALDDHDDVQNVWTNVDIPEQYLNEE